MVTLTIFRLTLDEVKQDLIKVSFDSWIGRVNYIYIIYI